MGILKNICVGLKELFDDEVAITMFLFFGIIILSLFYIRLAILIVFILILYQLNKSGKETLEEQKRLKKEVKE